MSANYNKYDDAMNKAKELTERYGELDKKLNAEMETYKQKAEELTGEKGLDKAFNKGSELAQKTAGEAATQAQASARQAGMSKAASAMMGANTSAGQYAQNLNNSTSQAYSANQDNLNAQGQNVANAQQNIGNINERVSQQTGMASQQANVAQAKQDQKYKGIGTGLQVLGSVGSMASLVSDERLKTIFGEEDCHKVTDLLSKINAIEFVYTEDAKDKYDGELNVDEDKHIGVSAQELEKNPLTESVVEINENGDRIINTSELTAVNTAALSSLAKEVKELKDMVWQLQLQEDDAHNRQRKEYIEEPHDKMITHIAEIIQKSGFNFNKGE